MVGSPMRFFLDV